MLKMPRALLLIALAWPAAAQSGPADREQAARDLLSNTAQALAERRAASFLEALDRPLAEQLRKPGEALVRSYDGQSALEFLSATADDRGVTLAIDWKLDLTAREGPRSITHRQRRIACRVESRGGALRIVALDGILDAPGFFSPPDVDGAWDLLQTAARALSQPDTPAAGFLAAFDSNLPDYEALRNGAEALAGQGQVNSTIGLTSDEGTDAARKLEVDWTIEVVNGETGIRIMQREAQLTFKVERRGKRWLIVSLAPLDFFATGQFAFRGPDGRVPEGCRADPVAGGARSGACAERAAGIVGGRKDTTPFIRRTEFRYAYTDLCSPISIDCCRRKASRFCWSCFSPS
jgi:hypothetical protein